MNKQIDIRALRVSLDLTQEELAERLGVDQSTVSNWERESGTKPRGPALKLLQSLVADPTPPAHEGEAV
ncbi:helix-turn-helix domain-containing protein [Nitrobacter sp. TKz-YC01]|uniref:helix-turn-helix domain-containing protein n=1 Tax=Nitrobacter sp. TKz-YC01 TaxID=3398703 RepID=UPI003A100AAA